MAPPWGPWPGVSGGGGGGFPGFGGAPPAIASASAAGASALASRSDHTHALDVVAYNPSLAGMQASGVIQQTYAAPTATPQAFNVAANLVPFGASAGTGILATNVRLAWFVGAGGFSTGLYSTDTNAASIGVSPFNSSALFVATMETGLGAYAAEMARNTTGAITWSSTKSRGTRAVPLAVAAGDSLVNFNMVAWSGSQKVASLTLSWLVPSDAAIGAATVPSYAGLVANADAGTNPNNISQYALAADSRANAYLGVYTLAVGSVDGFMYAPSVAGVVAGAPTQVFGSVRAGNRTASYIDTTDRRLYAYIGGAWHFAPYTDLVPVAGRIPYGGAAAGTLTSTANFTFDGTGSLTIGDATANGSVTLSQLGGGGTVNGLLGSLFLTANSGVASTTEGVRLSAGTSTDQIYVRQAEVAFIGNSVTQNVAFFATTPPYQGGQNIIFVHNRNAAPAGNPASGGYLYAEAGGLVWRGSAGTVTPIAPA